VQAQRTKTLNLQTQLKKEKVSNALLMACDVKGKKLVEPSSGSFLLDVGPELCK
jgi:hypothetical protein